MCKEGAELWVPVRDAITHCIHQLPVVQAYRHLGGIVTNTASVVPELHYRHAQAAWGLKPLRGPLFGNPSIPLDTRRSLLRSLVVSKFAFSTATVELHVQSHWRLWARYYVALWRALQPRGKTGHHMHSYTVLHTAQAPTPPLAYAKARAGLLLRILEHGPKTLRHLLFLQWEADEHKSWLGLFLLDLQHVALYCPAAQLLLADRSPVRALISALQEDRTWWKRHINEVCRLCAQDLQRWQAGQRTDNAACVATMAASPDDLPFACPICDARFALRKHRSTHVARRHGLLSPARIYAHHATCVACLQHYHTVARLQRHLKGSQACLRRTCALVPPLDVAAVRATEADDAKQARHVRTGQCQAFTAAQPVLRTAGPAQPTRPELRELLQEDAPLSLLYDPPVDMTLQCWALDEASYRTVEPPRPTAVSFWHRRVG